MKRDQHMSAVDLVMRRGSGVSRSSRAEMDEPSSSNEHSSEDSALAEPPWSLEKASTVSLNALWPHLVELHLRLTGGHQSASPEERRRLHTQLRDTQNSWALDALPEIPEWSDHLPLSELAASSIGRGLLMLQAWQSLEAMSGYEPMQGEHTRIRQTIGEVSWGRVLEQWARQVTRYKVPSLLDWPLNLDLTNWWLVGVSDFVGDRLLVVQGAQETLLAATRGLMPGRFRSLPINLTLNGAIQQKLSEGQAAILAPGVISEALVILD